MTTAPSQWTVEQLLQWATDDFAKRGMHSPRLDAEILLAHALSMPRIQLYVHFDKPAKRPELTAFRDLVQRRRRGEPIAYMVGKKGFWTFELNVDPRVLIPRPETELLVEQALARIEAEKDNVIVDVGTGSGAIAFALADETDALVAGVDCSDDAIDVARANAETLDPKRTIAWFVGDLLHGLPAPFDRPTMIVSNPPYVGTKPDEAIEPAVKEFEPSLALFAGPDGLDVYRRLVPSAYQQLRENGWLLCEMGHEQGHALRTLYEDAGFEHVHIYQDLGSQDRCIAGQKPLGNKHDPNH